jgi:hypothetical protein
MRGGYDLVVPCALLQAGHTVDRGTWGLALTACASPLDNILSCLYN